MRYICKAENQNKVRSDCMDLNFHIESYNKLFHALKEDVKTVDDLIALLR